MHDIIGIRCITFEVRNYWMLIGILAPDYKAQWRRLELCALCYVDQRAISEGREIERSIPPF